MHPLNLDRTAFNFGTYQGIRLVSKARYRLKSDVMRKRDLIGNQALRLISINAGTVVGNDPFNPDYAIFATENNLFNSGREPIINWTSLPIVDVVPLNSFASEW